jgi:hypothetical protein
MTRARTAVIGVLALSALALSSTASSAAAPLVKGSSGPLKATLAPSTHTPVINKNWPITVTATLNGKPAHATAVYQFLFAGALVQTEYPRFDKHFSFTGHFSDNLVFPAESVGEPLTLRVVIKDAGHTVNLPWSITAKK